MFAASVLHSFC